MQIDRRPPLTMKEVEARRALVRKHMCDLMKSVSLNIKNSTIRTSGSTRSSSVGAKLTIPPNHSAYVLARMDELGSGRARGAEPRPALDVIADPLCNVSARKTD
jgi:hypothetical protein